MKLFRGGLVDGTDGRTGLRKVLLFFAVVFVLVIGKCETGIAFDSLQMDDQNKAIHASFTTDLSGIMAIVGKNKEEESDLSTESKGEEDYITALKVTPDLVENYGKIRIEVTFSDGSSNEHVFHSGDTLSVEWPPVEAASLTGYRKTIPLVNAEGITYAVVEVTASGATLTFNEAVDGMYDVHGTFYFEALAVNNSPSEEEDTQSLLVIAGNKTTEVSIHKWASSSGESGETPDFRKDADYIGGSYTWVDDAGWVMSLDPEDPTYVQWVLTANENQHEIISDVLITDSMGSGQQLDTSYITIYCIGKNQMTFSGTAHSVIEAWKTAFPGCSLTFGDSGSIEWIISQAAADKTSWYLVYRCDITDYGLAYYENSAVITWEEADGETFSAHDEARFYNIGQGGDVFVLPRGVLQLTKKVEGTDLVVPGVTFTVEKQIDGIWTAQGTIKTDVSGKAIMTKLKSGSYRLYEVDVPSYLTPQYTDDNPYEFTIDTTALEHQSLELIVENPVQKKQIVGEKKWENADGTEDISDHSTIYFQLYRQSAAQSVPKAVGEPRELSDGMLTVVWEEQPVCDVFGNSYVYTVREVDADGNDWKPMGYDKEENGLSIVNRKRAAEITLKKTDPDGEGLTGAVFALLVEEKGVFVHQGELIYIDRQEGTTISGLESNKRYLLEEMQAPEGYVLEQKYIYFSLDDRGRLLLTDADGNSAAPALVSVSDDGVTMIVINRPGMVLPDTGGPGRYAYTPLAVALLFGGVMLWLKKRCLAEAAAKQQRCCTNTF